MRPPRVTQTSSANAGSANVSTAEAAMIVLRALMLLPIDPSGSGEKHVPGHRCDPQISSFCAPFGDVRYKPCASYRRIEEALEDTSARAGVSSPGDRGVPG